MAASSFDAALKRVLADEGGNDDDPRDPGGRTSRGILQTEWDRWRQSHPGLPSDVWRAPEDQVEAIYRQLYWGALRCDDLPAGVDYCVFDYGVNSGSSRAAKVLQQFVGVAQDGEVGPITIAAAKQADAHTLIGKVCDERLAFLQDLKTWPTFGRGWSARVAGVRAAAFAMVTAPPIDLTEPPWLVKARHYLGFHEVGDNRGIEEFIELAHVGQLGDSWCAIFANGMLESAGITGTRSALARSFEHDDRFVRLDKPVLGAITTMWRESPTSGSGHVGFYVGEDSRGVLLLGGNQRDQVCIEPQARAQITGYWWPKTVPVLKPAPVPAAPSAPAVPDLESIKQALIALHALNTEIAPLITLLEKIMTELATAAPAPAPTPVPAPAPAPAPQPFSVDNLARFAQVIASISTALATQQQQPAPAPVALPAPAVPAATPSTSTSTAGFGTGILGVIVAAIAHQQGFIAAPVGEGSSLVGLLSFILPIALSAFGVNGGVASLAVTALKLIAGAAAKK